MKSWFLQIHKIPKPDIQSRAGLKIQQMIGYIFYIEYHQTQQKSVVSSESYPNTSHEFFIFLGGGGWVVLKKSYSEEIKKEQLLHLQNSLISLELTVVTKMFSIALLKYGISRRSKSQQPALHFQWLPTELDTAKHSATLSSHQIDLLWSYFH